MHQRRREMKAKELFKKIEAHNELAQIIGDHEYAVTLWYNDETIKDDDNNYKIATYSEFKKMVKNVFVRCMAERIIDLDFEPSKEVMIWTTDYLGNLEQIPVQFDILMK